MESTDVYGLLSEDAVDELHRALLVGDIPEEHIVVHPAAPGRYQLHDERLRKDVSGAARGMLAGGVIGFAVGVIVALLVPAVDTAGEILVTAAAFAGLAGLVGAMAGLQRAEPEDDDPIRFREVRSDEKVAVVEVHDEHWALRAHRIMHRYGVDFLQEPHPTG